MTATVSDSTHWQDALRGAPAFADLPTDRPRPAAPTLEYARSDVVDMPVASTSAYIAGVAALLHRYTAQDDVLIALPASEAGWRVLRSDLNAGLTWADRLDATSAALAATATAPAISGPECAVGYAPALPAVHVAVICADDPQPLSLDGFDLVFEFDIAGLRVRYAIELFDAASIQRLQGHLATMLQAALTHKDEPIASLPMLSAPERRQLLHDWNQTAVPFQAASTVHQLIEAQAVATPLRTAVVFDTVELTYQELNERANKIAHLLIGQGACQGAFVGVYLERSADMLVVLIAILKTGAAYVPLDPNFPPDRLALMLEDSGLRLLVTQSSLAGVLETGEAVVQIVLDRCATDIEVSPDANPVVEMTSRDLMYVIYTSGSTGKPKGVMLEHRSVVNFLETMAREPGLGSDDRLLAVTTLSFDIAGLELFLPLVVGATVVIAPRTVTTDPQALATALDHHRITVMQATPATWRMLTEAGWPGNTRLKALCGGEALPQALAQALSERVSDVWNMYGPTETTIWSTIQRVVPDAAVSIGRAIANTTLYVLDPQFEPVPIGVAGELLIGGDGLARGYLGLEDLTADRFVADPFAAAIRDPQADEVSTNPSNAEAPRPRLYRTGDLVRYRADGRIEFIGRIDQQVKVRGFRIELGEIETVLGRSDGVEEVIVLARIDPNGDTRLVAYVTARSGSGELTASALRNAAKATLPNYMVPSLVVFLDDMPRTPNGKTDRKAMPEPDWANIDRDTPYVAPRDATEQRMTELWQDQLRIENIGVHDDFFDLGVESIVAARLFARIESEFRISLPVGTVFANPTVEALSKIINGTADSAPTWKSLVPIQTHGTKSPIFAVHGGAGTILLYGELARRLAQHDRPFYGLQAQGLYGGDPVQASVTAMATAYVPQIQTIQPHGPYIIAGYCYGALVAYEMVRLLLAAGETVELLISFNGPTPQYIKQHDPGGIADRAETASAQRRAISKVERIRNAIMYRVRNLQLVALIALRMPLPEAMRENYFFQRISIRAQFRYVPEPLDVAMATFHAEGLYREPDLGWNAFLTHPATSYLVPGQHRIARDSMSEPNVASIAQNLHTMLAAIEPDLIGPESIGPESRHPKGD